MIRHVLTIAAFTATAAALIATSRAPEPCAVETINVLAETTCGNPANVVLSSNQSCAVTAAGADFGGLPTAGSIEGGVIDGGMGRGFMLRGTQQNCNVDPSDAGFTIACAPSCFGGSDAGCTATACSGTLTLQ